MFALPPDLRPGTGDQVSGITCPTCHGSLRVRAEGNGKQSRRADVVR